MYIYIYGIVSVDGSCGCICYHFALSTMQTVYICCCPHSSDFPKFQFLMLAFGCVPHERREPGVRANFPINRCVFIQFFVLFLQLARSGGFPAEGHASPSSLAKLPLSPRHWTRRGTFVPWAVFNPSGWKQLLLIIY